MRPCTCAALAALPGFALGCANIGEPKPPSLHLPALVKDLAAERVGDRIALTWTTPRVTSDGETAAPGMLARLCREIAPARCQPLGVIAVQPGPSRFEAALPADLIAGPDRVLLVRVEIVNAAGRGAGLSDAAPSAAGVAPAPAGPLTATARREGIELAWQPAGTNGTMQLTRRVDATATAGTRGPGQGRRAPSPEIELQAPASAADPGGLLDRRIVDGARYTYIAQRTRQARIAGYTLTLRGEPSAPVSLLYRDTFAPAAPRDLVAIAVLGPPASIDLSWEPVLERPPALALAGYTVYRDAGSGFVPLNAAPVAQPAYRDLDVAPGRTYRYRVSATDLHHNESAPGPAVAQSLSR